MNGGRCTVDEAGVYIKDVSDRVENTSNDDEDGEDEEGAV